MHILPIDTQSSEIRASFVGRTGGVSPIPYDSLNVAENVGDDPKNVHENRKRLLSTLKAPPSLNVVDQVHGGRAMMLSELQEGFIQEADAIVLDQSGRAVLLKSADCPLVFLFDPSQGRAALAHCGWRGIAAGILENALTGLLSGGKSDAIRAFVSPSIGTCCFEVGSEVLDSLKPNGSRVQAYNRKTGKAHLDLKGVITDRLVERGLRAESIEVNSDCTKCTTDLYFSHRGNGGQPTGRNTGVVWLPRSSDTYQNGDKL